MKLLDLFSGAGGCSVGYSRAGFTEITGIDNRPMPRYPFRFVQADALDFLATVKPGEYDLIHASPPCQKFSAATPAAAREKHPDLIPQVRALLRATAIPYVIENVPGAPLESPLMLCGLMFGLRVFRHRLFESSHLILAPLHRPHGDCVIGHKGMVTVVDGGCARPWRARIGENGFVTVAGGGNSGRRDRTNGGLIRRPPEDGVAAWRRAMGISWMTRDELAQAIPPAYCEFLGKAFLAQGPGVLGR